jgi:hypothetical protein
MKINIRNYTSSVPAKQSINDIENILISLGARNIMKEYDGAGKILGIAFSIPHGEGVLPFRLPAKTDAIRQMFLDKHSYPTDRQKENAQQQSERTAWKNVRDWVDLQATMIRLEQVEFLEVFLPYSYNMSDNKTLFERFKGSGFKQLAE